MSERELFREQVVKAKSERWLGKTYVISPPTARFWTTCIAICIITIMTILAVGQYSRRERVTGMIMPEEGLVRIRARNSGEIARILVTEGQMVKAGTPLVLLRNDRANEKSDSLGLDLERDISQQNMALEADIGAVRDGLSQQLKLTDMQIVNMERQFTELRAAEQTQQSEEASQGELLGKLETLYRDRLITMTDLVRQRSAYATTKNALIQLRLQMSEISRQLDELHSKRKSLDRDAGTDIRDKERLIAQNRMELSRNSVERDMLVLSSVDGYVASLPLYGGQTVTAGQSIAAIVPRGSRVEVQLLVPSSAVGIIKKGDTVSLRYKAFPYEKYGAYKGSVLSISQSPMSPTEVSEMYGTTPGSEALYRVRVKVSDTNISTASGAKSLRPGMEVDASIMLEKRRLYEWLFLPYYAVKDGLKNEVQ